MPLSNNERMKDAMNYQTTMFDELFCTAESCFECEYFLRFNACEPDIGMVFERGEVA